MELLLSYRPPSFSPARTSCCSFVSAIQISTLASHFRLAPLVLSRPHSTERAPPRPRIDPHLLQVRCVRPILAKLVRPPSCYTLAALRAPTRARSTHHQSPCPVDIPRHQTPHRVPR